MPIGLLSLFLRGAKDFRRRNALCGAGGEREPHPGCILLGLRLIDYYRANPNELRLMGRREGRMEML